MMKTLLSTFTGLTGYASAWGYLFKYISWRLFRHGRGERGYVAIGGGSIYYEVHGAGPPLLLLHGGGALIESFFGQIPDLSRYYRLITVDSRGHGRSSYQKGLSYGEMAADVLTVLDHLRLDAVAIVGWSDGGITALHLALDHPERVRSLVLIGVNFHASGLRKSESARMEAMGPDDFNATAVRMYKRLSPHPKKWPQLWSDLKVLWKTGPDLTEEELGKIKAPTLLIAGERDLIDPDHLRQMQSAIPGAVLREIPGSTHAVLMEKPRQINALILDFLGPVTK